VRVDQLTEGANKNRAYHVLGVGGLVIQEGRVLMVKHNYGHLKGCWLLPGGHVDVGENLDAAVEREVLEETNITATAQGVVAVRSLILPDSRVETYVVFLMHFISGTVAPRPGEIAAADFFTREEVLNNPVATPLAKAIIGEVLDGSHRLLHLRPEFPQNSPNYRLYL
jgi:8-oxo-dGTP diphosphatase